MGLDMYLSKKNYVKRWEHNSPEEQFEISVKRGGETYSKIRPERISYVTEEVMYWRKANQIHGFFVNKGYEITPDVRYQLEGEHIVELLDTCKKVLEILNGSEKKTTKVVGGWKDGKEYLVDVEVYDKSDEILELLPPTEGFFFGSYQIDEWYKQQIEETISVLEEELSVSGDNYPEYEYYASW